ncbi:MAG: hypothetical protein ACKORB_00160 [Opitutia bacterium]
MSPERLIARIRLQLELGTPDLESRSLAAEYASLCSRVRERLEQCATLIGAGDDHAAFQAAEADPDLLGLCAHLSFSDADRWHGFCREHGLPAGFPLDDRHLLAVEGLYGRAIGESHPLYRDYRDAIRRRDEERALEVLRSIVRINPDDPNARQELSRLSSKFLRESLVKVAAAFAGGRESEAAGLMDRIERFGTGDLTGEPRWEEALARRQAWLRLRAAEQAEALRREIVEARRRDDWETCATALPRLRALERDHRLESPGEEIAEVEGWAGRLAAEAASEASARAAVQELEQELEKLRGDSARGGHPAALIARLGAWIERASAHEDRLPEGMAREARALRQRARARLSRRYTLLLSGWVAALLVIGAGAVWWNQRRSEEMREVQSVQQVRGLIARWDHAAAEKAIATLPANEETAALRRTLDQNRRAESAMREDAAYLRDVLRKGVRAEEAAKILGRLRAHMEKVEAAGPSAREALEKEFPDGSRLAAECSRALEQTRVELAAQAAALKAAIGEGENATDPTAAVNALDRMKALLKVLTDAGETRLDAFAAEADRASVRLAEERKVVDIRRTLDQSPDLRAYLDALAAVVKAQPPDSEIRRRATIVLEAAPKIAELPRAALAPRFGAMWDAAATADPTGTFMPPTLTEAESVTLKRVGDDSTTRRLRKLSHVYIESRGRRPMRPLVVVGEPMTQKNTINSGTEYITTADELTPEGAIVRGTWRRIEFNNDVKVGDFLPDDGPVAEATHFRQFARLVDENGRPTAPVLRTLDLVRRSDKAPVELRAWQAQELFKVAAMRPELWGLIFSPSAQRDAEKLRRVTQNAVSQHDFLVRERWAAAMSDLSLALVRSAGPDYAKEAAFWRTLTGALRAKQMVYAGHVASDGRASVREKTPGEGLYGLYRDGKPALLFRTDAQGQPERVVDAAPYSPLLRMPGTVEESVKAAGGEEIPAPPGGWESILQGRDI